MSTATLHKTNIIRQDHWQQRHDVVTHNDVIDAYLQGKKAGRDEWKIAMRNLFEINLTKAQNTSELLYEDLKQLAIQVDSLHLKADSVTNFIVLIVTTLEDYVTGTFLQGIKISRKIKTEADSTDFTINFSFTYKSDNLSEKCLESDGYFLKFYGHK